MHDTLEPALDLFDEVVEEPDLSGLVRDPRPMVSTESRQLAEQTAARLVATGGGTRQRRGNWPAFVRCAAIFLFGAGALLGLGVAQDLFRKSDCTFRNRSVIRWGMDQPQAVVDGCVKCHPRSTEPAAAPAVLHEEKGEWPQLGLRVPVRMETFLADRRQHFRRCDLAAGNPGLRTFVCAVLGRSPGRVRAPAICGAPKCRPVQVAQVSTRDSHRAGAHAGRICARAPHGDIAGLRREQDATRWS
jgi:hypothetical protein